MAAVTAPAHVSAQHQKLLHFVANATWSDEQMLAKVRELVVPSIVRHGPIEAWIIDDTSFPKQGSHSVRVHHQYCGQLGKQANCQVAVTLSIANHHASLPIAYRLYLPQAWIDDAARRAKTHVPAAIKFKTKPQIALEQIRAARAAGVPRGVVLVDASYGSNKALRDGITALELTYAAATVPTVKVRPVPAPSTPPSRCGAPPRAWKPRQTSNVGLRATPASQVSPLASIHPSAKPKNGPYTQPAEVSEIASTRATSSRIGERELIGMPGGN